MMTGPAPHGFSCPRCQAAATPQLGAQTCGGCKGAFTLHSGLAAEAPLVLPAPDASWRKIQVKAPGLVLMSYGAGSRATATR